MDYNNKVKGYFENIRYEMIDFLPKHSKTLLDVGCSEGNFASYIKKNNEIEAWGIELMEAHGKIAEKKLDKVLIGDCEKCIPDLPDGYFDVIFFNDVLEHLVDPYSVLENIKQKLSPNGVIISSIPNVRYHRVFKSLILKKQWEYTMDGVLDKTHLRFFTSKSILKMYEDLGFEIILHKGINKTKSLRPYLYNIPFFFTAMDMFYQQYATVVKLPAHS